MLLLKAGSSGGIITATTDTMTVIIGTCSQATDRHTFLQRRYKSMSPPMKSARILEKLSQV
jgi:hypothetical protein